MAVLKDLIVHGPSKFIGTSYIDILEANKIRANEGIFTKLAAKNASVDDTLTVNGLLDVYGELHTKSWSNSNIATVDGNLHIVPTITAASVTGTITYSSSAYSMSLTGAFATNTLTIGNSATVVAWTPGSKLIVSGEVKIGNEWLPLGTLKCDLGGSSNLAIDAANKTISLTSITDANGQTSGVLESIRSTLNLSGTSSSLNFRNVKVAFYSRKNTSMYPIGILLTAQGTGAGKTFIDMYNGNNAASGTYGGLALPVVRIGNLSGSSLPAVGGQTPVGWGIYTSNGYFSGVLASTSGNIGGFTLANSALYSGTNSLTSTTAGIYVGTGGIRNYNSATQYVQIQNGKITAQGADINGTITASSGKIGGFELSATQLNAYGTASAAGTSTTGLYRVLMQSAPGTNGGNIAFGVSTRAATSDSWTWKAYVNHNGHLGAVDASITGSITATAFTAKSGSTTRTTVDGNGLTVYNTAGTVKVGQFNNAVTLGAANSGNAYINGTAMQFRNGTSVLSQFDTNGISIYNGTDIFAFFGKNGTNPYSYLGSKTKTNSPYLEIYSDGMALYSTRNKDQPIMKITQGDTTTTGGSTNYNIEATTSGWYLGYSSFINSGSNKTVNRTCAVTGLTPNRMNCTFRYFEQEGTEMTFSTTNSLTNDYFTGTYNSSTGEVTITVKPAIFNKFPNYVTTTPPFLGSAIGYFTDGIDGIWIDTNDTTLTKTFAAPIKSGTTFKLNDSQIMPNTYATIGPGDTSTKTFTITQTNDSNQTSTATFTAVYNNSNRTITIKKTSGSLLEDALIYLADVQIQAIQLVGISIETVSEYANAAYDLGVRIQETAGNYSFITGFELSAPYAYQTVIGKHNISVPDASFIVGNGESNSKRSNAFSMTWDGEITSPRKGRVLWTGAYYMINGQVIKFANNQKVSDQLNGIVLVWSAYASGEAKDYNWDYQFIPKWHVLNHNGQGVDYVMMIDAGTNITLCKKYVYVYDDKIGGNANNSKSGTGFNNASKVLRAVIGV